MEVALVIAILSAADKLLVALIVDNLLEVKDKADGTETIVQLAPSFQGQVLGTCATFAVHHNDCLCRAVAQKLP